MIRDLSSSDLEKLRLIHVSSGADYLFPDLDSPLFVNKLVSEQGGKLIAAGLHKVCYETFVLVDPKAGPREKWDALGELNEALATRAYWQGLDLIHASIPPIGFDKRLRQLGWEPDREGWRLWSRVTNAVSSKSGV